MLTHTQTSCGNCVCVFCYVDVTVDNIGLTGRYFHICKDCIHSDKGLEFLESPSKENDGMESASEDEPPEHLAKRF